MRSTNSSARPTKCCAKRGRGETMRIPIIVFLAVILAAGCVGGRDPVRPAALCTTDSECAEMFGGNGDPDDPPLVPSVPRARCDVWLTVPNEDLPAPGQWAIHRDCEAA